MKRKSVILLIVFAVLLGFKAANAQEQPKVETFYLENGLKVVLYEDHSEPTVHGTVFVHAGSKNDPLDATGMAHYFEHIMFKGTDKIGTTNWEAEKVYLDSIDIMYDKLHDTENQEERASIQKKINELSIASTDYAIPNEVDLILTKMGGEGLNAGTSYDFTVYFNSFPSNQVEKWMDVYVERFRNPVFRLFQSELETVYEEKNMYNDEMVAAFAELMFKECFGEHPYGRPVIGLTEHLKNPQTTKMREFFNTYYVANNMTLIMVGDFVIEDIKPLIEEKFSVWEKRELPESPKFEVPVFDKEVVKKVRLTPIKMGFVLYNGINNSHEDKVAFEVLTHMFSNNGIGLLDQAILNNEIMLSMMLPLTLEDHGAIAFLYVPKLLGQSFDKAEQVLFDAMNKIKSGDFSDDLLEAAKTTIVKDRVVGMEGIDHIAELLMDLESRGLTVDEYIAETEKIKNVTKDDVINVANKYLTENRTILRSSMGFPAKDNVDKPNWKAIDVKNTELKSEFAKQIESQEVEQVKPQVIEFGKDVIIENANDAFPIYATKNPYNNIFDLNITYNYGTIDNPELDRANDLHSFLGTSTMTYEEIELELQKMGASVYIDVREGYTTLNISGFDENLNEILDVCEDMVFNVQFDEDKLNLIVQTDKMNKKTERTEPDVWDGALYQYVLYGDKSSYLTKMPIKKWAKRGEDILNDVKEIFNYSGSITYTGNVDTKEVVALLKSHNLIKDDAIKAEKKVKEYKKYDDNIVFFAHSNQFRQSKIRMYVPGEKLNEEEKVLASVFNKYFGTDMYSIVFQEIRELRSLGYTAYSIYSYDNLNRIPGHQFAYLGTQSDKTNEAVDAMRELLVNMPEKMEKFETSKEALIMSRAADYLTPRNLPLTVEGWIETGYNYDPRMEMTDVVKATTYNDIYKFYQDNVQNRPIIIMITGNKNDVDMEALKQYGEVKLINFDEIYK